MFDKIWSKFSKDIAIDLGTAARPRAASLRRPEEDHAVGAKGFPGLQADLHDEVGRLGSEEERRERGRRRRAGRVLASPPVCPSLLPLPERGVLGRQVAVRLLVAARLAHHPEERARGKRVWVEGVGFSRRGAARSPSPSSPNPRPHQHGVRSTTSPRAARTSRGSAEEEERGGVGRAALRRLPLGGPAPAASARWAAWRRRSTPDGSPRHSPEPSAAARAAVHASRGARRAGRARGGPVPTPCAAARMA